MFNLSFTPQRKFRSALNMITFRHERAGNAEAARAEHRTHRFWVLFTLPCHASYWLGYMGGLLNPNFQRHLARLVVPPPWLWEFQLQLYQYQGLALTSLWVANSDSTKLPNGLMQVGVNLFTLTSWMGAFNTVNVLKLLFLFRVKQYDGTNNSY